MPISYLEGQTGNWNALGGLGNTFSDAVWRLRENSIRGMQWQQQMAMQAAQLQMEQERLRQQQEYQRGTLAQRQREQDFSAQQWREQQPLREVEYDLRKAEANRQAAEASRTQGEMQSGGVLGDVMQKMYETDPQRNPDTYAFLRALAAQKQTQLAANAPGNIVRQMNELMVARDPHKQELMATGMTPYHSVPGVGLVDFTRDVPSVMFPARSMPRSGMSPELQQLKVASDLMGNMQKNFVAPTDPMYQSVTNAVTRLMPQAFGQGQQSNVKYARNPQTGQRIMSTDGGVTWSPAN